MSNEIQQLRNRLEQSKGQKAQVEKSLSNLKKLIIVSKRALRKHEQAREIMREVGLKTQQQLQFHIGDITSLALEAVFNEPYNLAVEFVQRRNKTECDLYFVRNEERLDPLSATGGGTIDVAAFALRIASWSMARPRTRNTIILDEPLRFLSEEYREKASQMIKEISEKLGLQFIIITHEPTLASAADKVFEVKIKKGISQIN